MAKGCGSSSRRALRRAASLTLETLEGRRLLSVGTNAGNQDGGFGNGGILTTDFPGAATTDVPVASAQVDGGSKLVVIGTASGQPVMARYDFATGGRDTTFGVSTDGVVQIPGSVLSTVSSIAVDDNGNLLVGGTDGSNEGAVARYSADGVLDTSFGVNGVAEDGIASSGVGGVVTLSGNVYASVSGTGNFTLVKFDNTGALDGTFGGSGFAQYQDPNGASSASAIAVNGSGILLAGVSTQVQGPGSGDSGQDTTFVQFDSSGNFDSTFNGAQPLVLLPTVTQVPSGNIRALDVSSGSILAAGNDSTGNFLLVHLDSSGNLDTNFDGGSGYTVTNFNGTSADQADSVGTDSLGNIYLTGQSDSQVGVARYSSTGAPDANYGFNGAHTFATATASGGYVATDGSVRVIASALNNSGDSDFAQIDITPAPALNTSFGNGGIALDGFSASANDQGHAVAQQSDGKLVVGGTTSLANGDQPIALVRYNTDGSLDTTFGSGGRVTLSVPGYPIAVVEGITITSDANGGKIVVAFTATDGASNDDMGVAIFNPDGTVNQAPVVAISASTQDEAVAVGLSTDAGQSSIYVAGTESDGTNSIFELATFDMNGGTPTSTTVPVQQGGSETDSLGGMVVQSDGKIVLGGTTNDGLNPNQAVAVRLLSNGTPDVNFNGDGIALDTVDGVDVGGAVAVDSSGNVYVGGFSNAGNASIIKFDSTGQQDASFGTSGVAGATFADGGASEITSLAVDSQGRIVGAGTEFAPDSSENFGVVRFNSDGTPDATFDGGSAIAAFPGGVAEVGGTGVAISSMGMTLQTDGNIVVVGTTNGTDFAAARFLGSAVSATPPSFSISGASQTDEGATYTLTLSSSNLGSATIDHWTIDWGDGSTPEVVGDVTTATHPYADGPNSFAISATANDGQNVPADNTVSVTVNNVAPTVSLSGATSADEGNTKHYTFTTSDPGSLDTFSVVSESGGSVGTLSNATFDSTTGAGSFDVTFTDGPATSVVSIELQDNNGALSNVSTVTVTVGNIAPTLTATGTGVAAEGSSYVLNLSANDPGTDTISSWSIDWGDGNVQSVAGNPSTTTHAYADNGNYTIQASATDEDGTYSAANSLVAVSNVAPTAAVSGPSSLQAGDSGSFTLGATDPSAVDQQASFTFQVDWGDGSGVQTFTAPVGTVETHTYASQGNFTVSVLATDKDGGTSASPATLAVAVSPSQPPPPPVGAQLVSDPLNPGKTELLVTGSTGNDAVLLTSGANGSVNVFFAGVTNGSFNPTGRIVINGGDGNDIVILAGLNRQAEVYGGAGNDIIVAGKGGNIVVGGDGNDLLIGGSGRDVLIGGTGADSLLGASADDILVAGTTSFDNDPASLNAIYAEWNSSHSYADRLANLKGDTSNMTRFNARLNGNVFIKADAGASSTVFDDTSRDVLTGGAGVDWFLFNSGTGIKDSIVDRSGNETGTDI